MTWRQYYTWDIINAPQSVRQIKLIVDPPPSGRCWQRYTAGCGRALRSVDAGPDVIIAFKPHGPNHLADVSMNIYYSFMSGVMRK